MRWRCFGLLTGVLLILSFSGSCSSLEEEPIDRNLVPLLDIPAEWGQLVAVTQYPQMKDGVGWYELWFSNPAAGTITHVPLFRSEWGYDPEKVRVVRRAG